jgi:hypothetical protein
VNENAAKVGNENDKTVKKRLKDCFDTSEAASLAATVRQRERPVAASAKAALGADTGY